MNLNLQGIYCFPESGLPYKQVNVGQLAGIDLDEKQPLPTEFQENKMISQRGSQQLYGRAGDI